MKNNSELEDAFELFLGPNNESGVITLEDLRKVAEELEEDMTDEELKEMIMGANKGADKLEVDKRSFVQILKKSNA